jgi:hypothetical protein
VVGVAGHMLGSSSKFELVPKLSHLQNLVMRQVPNEGWISDPLCLAVHCGVVSCGVESTMVI